MHAPLTFRQERFALEYLKDQNASAAAGRAGYTALNLASQSNELMNNPAIRDRIRNEMKDLLAELRCSALELMKQRMRAAFFLAEKMFGEDGKPLAIEAMESDTKAAVEVRTVLRKGGPIVYVKQPDRNKALRALEKAHERLDRLNEQYYAQLVKAGKAMTLEEIEAMDGQGATAPVDDISEKDQVLSGSEVTESSRTASPSTSLRTGFDRLRMNGVGSDISEKPQVLSGSEVVESSRLVSPSTSLSTNGGGAKISEKPQVLSGSKAATEKPGAQISEKPQVLSGRPAAAQKPGGDFSQKCQGLSGSEPALPRSKVTRPSRQAREYVERLAKNLGVPQSIPEHLIPSMEQIRAMVREQAAENGVELAPA